MQDNIPGNIKLKDGTPFNFYLYGGGREAYCRDLIVPRIQNIKPDVTIILLDTFMLYPWLSQMDLSPTKLVGWWPTDGGGGLPNGCEQIVKKCYYPIMISKFGKKQIKEIHNIETDYIPHAVNSELFKPISKKEKEQLKIKYNLVGKYIVGLVGRNQGRKMHDRAIKAFA